MHVLTAACAMTTEGARSAYVTGAIDSFSPQNEYV
jgi:hypothetical protein